LHSFGAIQSEESQEDIVGYADIPEGSIEDN